MEYPEELHDLHNDLPLAPERLPVNGVEKLISHLGPRKKYVLHYKILKLYLELGMKLVKIHRRFFFKDDAWMKPYIDLNTQLRAKATDDLERDYYNLKSNAMFGKTMENMRNQVDIRLRTNKVSAEKLTAKPNYKKTTIFSENLIAIHMKKTEIKFEKTVYLGMSILDIARTPCSISIKTTSRKSMVQKQNG